MRATTIAVEHDAVAADQRIHAFLSCKKMLTPSSAVEYRCDEEGARIVITIMDTSQDDHDWNLWVNGVQAEILQAYAVRLSKAFKEGRESQKAKPMPEYDQPFPAKLLDNLPKMIDVENALASWLVTQLDSAGTEESGHPSAASFMAYDSHWTPTITGREETADSKTLSAADVQSVSGSSDTKSVNGTTSFRKSMRASMKSLGRRAFGSPRK